MDVSEQKIIETYCDDEGRITQFPTKKKKFEVLLRYVLKPFEVGVHYPEKQVNEILAKFNPDTALFRRALIEYKFMAREGGGGAYQVVGRSEDWLPWAEMEK
ncbi:MAG: DUF2087 domain-containing protein [Chloroflexota bacterium]